MNRTRSNFGFTLLELIVVMVIMSVIFAMVVPSLSEFAQGRKVGDAANEVVALAHWARTHAIARGITFRLNFDPGGSAYWLTMQNGASFGNLLQNDQNIAPTPTVFGDVGEEPGRRFSTPAGVTLTCTVPLQQDGQYVEFRPTGRCDPATVSFTDKKGKVIEVGCLAATESWHVFTDDERQQEQQQQQLVQPSAQVR